VLQPESPRAGLTKRQFEVLERLEHGFGAKQIATDLGISRNAVYQTIERLRRQGAIAESYTPSGQPPRRSPQASAPPRVAIAAPRESAVTTLRGLARSGSNPETPEYAAAIEEAIARGDAVALAYELGHLDAGEGEGLPRDLIESALRRLGVLPRLDAERK